MKVEVLGFLFRRRGQGYFEVFLSKTNRIDPGVQVGTELMTPMSLLTQ